MAKVYLKDKMYGFLVDADKIVKFEKNEKKDEVTAYLAMGDKYDTIILSAETYNNYMKNCKIIY